MTAKPLKRSSVDQTYTKSQIVKTIAEHVDLTQKQAEEVLDVLKDLVHDHLRHGHAFVFPGIAKIKVVRKKKRSARIGINPQTRKPMEIAEKPEHDAVKVIALKQLIDAFEHKK